MAALTKSQQSFQDELTKRAELLPHTPNALVVPPSPMHRDGPGFRLLGYQMDWRVEEGEVSGVMWQPILSGSPVKKYGSQTRIEGVSRIYATKALAYLAAYCL